MHISPESLKTSWEKELAQHRTQTTGVVAGALHSILYGGGFHTEDRNALGIADMTGPQYYEFKEKIELFLSGLGPQDSGLYGLINTVRNQGELRQALKGYGGGLDMPEPTGNVVDDTVAMTKRWLANKVWNNLNFKLRPFIVDQDTQETYPPGTTVEF